MSQDHLRMKITHGFIGPRNAQIFSLNNAQILIWPPDYKEMFESGWQMEKNKCTDIQSKGKIEISYIY